MLFLRKRHVYRKYRYKSREETNQDKQVPDLRPSKIDQVAVEVPAFGNQVQDEARYPKGILRGRKQGSDKEEKRKFSENPGISLVTRATISQVRTGKHRYPG